jgi:excisionase family DNA binding protein
MGMEKTNWSKQTGSSDKLLLTADDVAHRLSLSRATVYKMLASGELQVFRTGRSVRVSVKQLEKWIEKQSLPSTVAAEGDRRG